MESYDEEAVSVLRTLSCQFVRGKLTFEEFYGVFCKTAHRLFDADQASMPKPVAEEVEFYLRWEGFGPRKGHVPQNVHWRYGDPEPFGWIDKSAFAGKFAEEFGLVVPTSGNDRGNDASA